MTDPLRVASVPVDHVYVRHLAAPTGAGATGAGPTGAGATGAGPVIWLPERSAESKNSRAWWSSPVLEPWWLQQNAHLYDLVHLHFGFEHRTLHELGQFVEALQELRRPLVVTVHDLMNPLLTHQRNHLAALALLLGAASEVITLTPGAAAEINQRWGRPVQVLPHPHVVPLDRLGAPRPAHDGFVVGLHRERRPNCDPDALQAFVVAAVAAMPGATLHQGHEQPLGDAELWDYLAGLDALVLPYRFGSHSGLIEACHDLGTTVIAPRVGFFAEQQALLSYDMANPASVAQALRLAYDERPGWRADPRERERQRMFLAEAHAVLYARALQQWAA